jgi:hypothetical protein
VLQTPIECDEQQTVDAQLHTQRLEWSESCGEERRRDGGGQVSQGLQNVHEILVEFGLKMENNNTILNTKKQNALTAKKSYHITPKTSTKLTGWLIRPCSAISRLRSLPS